MDMFGYNPDANRSVELHAGCTDPAIRDLSLPLADRVRTATAPATRPPTPPMPATSSAPWRGR
jgi:hypothetical protein